MRKEEGIATLLRRLAQFLNEEADRNPEFAERLKALLAPGLTEVASRRRHGSPELEKVPDVYKELAARGDSEFRLWLRHQPPQFLHAIIRRHDLDATRRSAKWKDSEKLSTFIAEQIRARQTRGSGFLSSGGQSRTEPETDG